MMMMRLLVMALCTAYLISMCQAQDSSTATATDDSVNKIDAQSAVLNDYRPPLYVPTADVKNIHGVPRLIGDTKEFDYGSTDYWKGAVGTGAPQVVIGLLLLIGMPCFVCCTGKKQSTSAPSKLFLLITMCCLGMAFVGITIGATGNTTANTAGDSVVESVVGVETLLTDAGLIFDDLAKTALELSVLVEGIDADDCPTPLKLEDGGEKGKQLLELQNNLIDNIQSEMADIVIYRDDFHEQHAEIIERLQDAQELITTYNSDRSAACLAALAFCGFLLSCYAFTLLVMGFCKNSEGLSRVARCIGKLITPFSILVIVFVWVFAGFVMILAVVTSDFCFDVDNTITDLVVELGDSVDTVGDKNVMDIVTYYQSCVGENPFAETLSTAQIALDETGNQLQDDSLKIFIDFCGMKPQLDAMSEAVVVMTGVRASAELLISCGNISKLYQLFLHTALCDELVSSLALQWGAAFLIGFFFFFGTLTYSSYSKAQSKYISARHSAGSDLEMDVARARDSDSE